MSRFVKLPVSRLLIDLDKVLFVGQVELNKYNVFFSVPTPAFPTIEARDLGVLETALAVEVLKAPEEPKVVAA